MIGFVRAALPDSPAALPTERNSHAAVAIDSDLLVLGGESNAELVQEMCMIDTAKQVQHSCHQLSSSCKIVVGIGMMSFVILPVHPALCRGCSRCCLVAA